MTYDHMTTGEQIRIPATIGDAGGFVTQPEGSDRVSPDVPPSKADENLSTANRVKFSVPSSIPSSTVTPLNSDSHDTNLPASNCYNQVLDDEIKSRLDKLNALSDLINSLERQFDESNSVFRHILKCSTERLSSIAKTLGEKSIKRGRAYQAAKIAVEQSQTDCKRACVLFEQANQDHQFAREAIKGAEQRLRAIAGELENDASFLTDTNFNSIDIAKLTLGREPDEDYSSNHPRPEHSSSCDTDTESSVSTGFDVGNINQVETPVCVVPQLDQLAQETQARHCRDGESLSSTMYANKLNEELNLAISKLVEAEKKRGLTEQQHLDKANKLMIAQENLVKIERDHGPSIRRSQSYFEEAKRFNARLSSVKGEISRISESIQTAKRAYASTLSELEQFSDNLHDTVRHDTHHLNSGQD